jgi:hypothetical protein
VGATHAAAYVSIRQHTSAYVWVRRTPAAPSYVSQEIECGCHTYAYVSIRQHTSAYVSIRRRTPAAPSYVSQEIEEIVDDGRLLRSCRRSSAAAASPVSFFFLRFFFWGPHPSESLARVLTEHTQRQHTSACVGIRQHTYEVQHIQAA